MYLTLPKVPPVQERGGFRKGCHIFAATENLPLLATAEAIYVIFDGTALFLLILVKHVQHFIHFSVEYLSY